MTTSLARDDQSNKGHSRSALSPLLSDGRIWSQYSSARLHEISLLEAGEAKSRQGRRSGAICAGVYATPIGLDPFEHAIPATLMLSLSTWPAMSTSTSLCSLSDEMDEGPLMVDCNLPELLVRDLDASEAIFTSKDMTAGCPCAGLAAPEFEVGPSFPRPILPYRPSYPAQLPMNRPDQRALVRDGATPCVPPHDDGMQPEAKTGPPDSSSVMLLGMGPLSIRTRQQSGATAATSLSGRCSSLFSQNLSPTTPVLSPCSSNRDSSSHGTWYEAEEESSGDQVSSVYTGRTSISDPPQTILNVDNDDSGMAAQRGSATNEAECPTVHDDYDGSDSRPHLPPSHAQLEKPRIIDIPPAPPGLKRALSTMRRARGADSVSVASDPQETLAAVPPTIERHRQGAHCGGLQGEPVIHLLSTANGRTVIDASGPASTNQPIRDETRNDVPVRNVPSAAVHGGKILDRGEESSANTVAEEPTAARKPPLPDLRRRFDVSADTLASSQSVTVCTSRVPSPGIPPPPEVIESLRVSISCFPETMLLTSSLSIETIRAYAKKVKHQANLARNLRNTINDAFYSSASHNARPSKRWNMSWLGHARRSCKHYQHHQPQLPPQPYALPRSSQPPNFDLSMPTLASGAPLTPVWAPIKNIFPSASDYQCDALYAHLLAYNYISSLCSATTLPQTPVIPPKSSHQQGPGDDSARNLKVPQKAATLLGMDDPMSAAAAYQHRHHRQFQSPYFGGLSPNGRGLSGLSRRTGSAEGSSHALQDSVFLPPRSSSRSAGVGNSPEGSGSGSAAMREIQAGLGRCVGLLVKTMTAAGPRSPCGSKKTFAGGDDESTPSLPVGDASSDGEVGEGIEPVLMRALCEVVRCAEEGNLCGM